MIGIRRSDEPILNAASAVARGDREALRAAIKQSEELAARSDRLLILHLAQQSLRILWRFIKLLPK